MLYTRDDAIQQARNYIVSFGTEFLTDPQMEAFANQANEMVYREIVNHWPDAVTTTSAFTFPSQTASISLTSVLGAVPMRVKTVEDTQVPGAYSATNWTRTWDKTDYTEIMRYRTARTPLSQPLAGIMAKYLYCVDQDTLHIAPAAATTLNCRIRWIPYLEPMTAGTDEVLNGYMTQFGQYVGVALAYLANIKQGGINQAVTAEWQRCLANIKQTSDERSRGVQFTHTTRIDPFR